MSEFSWISRLIFWLKWHISSKICEDGVYHAAKLRIPRKFRKEQSKKILDVRR